MLPPAVFPACFPISTAGSALIIAEAKLTVPREGNNLKAREQEFIATLSKPAASIAK